MTRIESIEKYIQDLLGQDVVIRPLKQKSMNGLPLYLSKTYIPYEMMLLDKSIVLFLRKAERSESPARIAKDAAGLQTHFEKDVAMVLDEVASWERKRLIEKQVPFIVPGRQLYLPMLLLDLRERFPKTTVAKQKYLSRAAQHTLLRQILHGDVENHSMADVANLLGYSAMTMTKVREELVALDLCGVEKHGRSLRIVFSMPNEQLWSTALQHMRSPVFRKHFVIGKADGWALLAGPSALAEKSLLQPDDRPTFAVWRKRYEGVLKDNHLVEIDAEDGSDLIVEEWYYDPRNISKTDEVDPLSLYLSLREDPDERIQIALEEMMETLIWSKG